MSRPRKENLGTFILWPLTGRRDDGERKTRQLIINRSVVTLTQHKRMVQPANACSARQDYESVKGYNFVLVLSYATPAETQILGESETRLD